MEKAYLETIKFIVRLALLVFIPMLVARLAQLQGEAKLIVDTVLPILLPIIDKWIHHDERIKAKGLIPF